MNLVMRGAHQQMAQPTGECDPQLRMLQVNVKIDEEDEDDIGFRQAVLRHALAEQVVTEAVRQPVTTARILENMHM